MAKLLTQDEVNALPEGTGILVGAVRSSVFVKCKIGITGVDVRYAASLDLGNDLGLLDFVGDTIEHTRVYLDE
jgi:hypothetical protein